MEKGGRLSNFSKFARKLRHEHGLSTRQVADLSKKYPDTFTSSFVVKLEHGKLNPTITRLTTLANIYDVPIEEFSEYLKIPESFPAEVEGLDFRELHNKASEHTTSGDYHGALNYFNASAEKAKNDDEKLASNANAARSLMRMGCLQIAKTRVEQAMKQYPRVNRERLFYCFHLLGDSAFYIENYILALAYSKSAMEIAEQRNAPHLIALALGLKGRIFEYQKDFENAIKHYDLQFHIQKERNENKEMAISLANKCECYFEMLEINQGLEILHKALNLIKDVEDPYSNIYMHNFLLKAHYLTRDFQKAREVHQTIQELLQGREYHDLHFISTFYLWRIARDEHDDENEKRLIKQLRFYSKRTEKVLNEMKQFRKLLRGQKV